MKLYELTSEYAAVLEWLEANPEDDGLHEQLSQIADAIENKAEYIARVIKTLEGEAEVYKTEADRLTARRRTAENRISSMKRYLEENMRTAGVDKIRGELFTVALQKNPASVNVLDEKEIPIDYFIQQDPVLDKRKLLEILKMGESIPGCELKQTESLRIR